MRFQIRLKSTATLLTALCLILTVSGCNRYVFTVNDQPVFEPAPLFDDYLINDTMLAQCVRQTIIDKKITTASDLTQLVCTHAGITQLEGLNIFTGLTQIDFSGNKLSSIKPILFLPYIESVNLTENPSLDCKDTKLLSEQLKDQQLILPTHCR